MSQKFVFNNEKILGNKTPYTVALILMLTLGVFAILPVANSSTPPIKIPTYAYLAISPNPIGVGQSVFLVMWLHMAPPTSSGIAGDRWHDFVITATKPNGDTQTVGTFISDPTGSAFVQYTPDQIGTYKFEFKFTGQVLSLYNPQNGLPGSSSPYINDTFLPSSTTAFLTVQKEQIAPVEDYPQPTQYWTRPIEGANTNWASLVSSWLGGAQIGGYNLWQKDGIAPNTSHIMWTKPLGFGGVVGGSSAIPNVGFYSGGSYEGRFANSIIMYGRLYYQEPLGHSNTGGGYTAVDLRTGEVIWHRDDMGVIGGSSSPTFGQLFDYESFNQHGVVGGTLWAAGSSTQYDPTGGTVWMAYDANTGISLYNLTGIPSGTTVYSSNGAIVSYVLNYNTTRRSGWLALWNNTADQTALQAATGTGTSAYQWRPNGKLVNMSTAYTWNVTIPALPGNSAPAIVQIIQGDIILGRSSAVAAGVGDKFTPDPYTMWAISDKPATRGQLLWIKNYSAPAGNLTRRLATVPVDPVNRVWLMSDVETMQWLGYSLDTGDLLWGPTNIPFNAYQYYGSGEGGGQRGSVAYGNLYVQGFGGEIFAYSTKNGSLLWRFNNTNSGIDTPWGLRPIFLAAIADGKVYAFNNEHSPNVPLYKGNKVYAIDAFTGKEVWSMLGWAGQTGGQGRSTAVLAEGFFVYYNYYDSQIYCIGKGPSATTVTASPKVATKGSPILIEGTVTDQSPGAKDKPAMSDKSMSQWMEYLYMQKPKPGNATGVKVKLTAIDPNGNTQNIGTTTTDIDGKFGITWTPPVEGTYNIKATFDGGDSYWGSYGTTYTATSAPPPASVTPPAAATPTATQPSTTTAPATPSLTGAPSPQQGSPTEMYIVAAAAVAIIVVAAVAAFVLRRRK